MHGTSRINPDQLSRAFAHASLAILSDTRRIPILFTCKANIVLFLAQTCHARIVAAIQTLRTPSIVNVRVVFSS